MKPPPLSGARPSLLRQINERQVLAAIQTHGPMSRAEITRLTGISGPTVTRAVAALLEGNLLEEGEFRQSGLGRPGKCLRLAANNISVLGAVVGSEHCELVAAGLDGQVREKHVHTFDTPAGYEDLLKQLASRIQTMAAKLKTAILGVGVTAPGLLQGDEKRVLLAANLHQMDGRTFGADLRERIDIETTVVHESHALCLAEKMYGAARDVDNFAMLNVTDGLGLGVFLNGQLLKGNSGLAGELGHVTVQLEGRLCGCGNRGCLETVATDSALVRTLSARLARRLTVDDILEGVLNQEIEIGAEFEDVVQYLSIAVAAVVNIFNPRRLFIHSRLLDASPILFQRLMQLTHQRSLAPLFADCEIVRARGNKRLGAIASVLHRVTTGLDMNGILG